MKCDSFICRWCGFAVCIVCDLPSDVLVCKALWSRSVPLKGSSVYRAEIAQCFSPRTKLLMEKIVPCEASNADWHFAPSHTHTGWTVAHIHIHRWTSTVTTKVCSTCLNCTNYPHMAQDLLKTITFFWAKCSTADACKSILHNPLLCLQWTAPWTSDLHIVYVHTALR